VKASIALVQMTGAPYAADANRRRSAEQAGLAFAGGADLVVLPEMVVPGYVTDPVRLLDVAEPIDGPTVEAWSAAAADGGGYVVGGFCERDGDALYNTAVVVDGDGVVLHYRKLHLFASEKEAFEPGDLGLPVAQTRLGVLGVCVCYDLRFVETVRVLALRGAQVVCVPTAWVVGFDQQRLGADGIPPQAQGALLQANLNQVFIACASQVGRPGDVDMLGGSVLADPFGKPVTGPLSTEYEEVDVAEVDLAQAAAAQVRGGGVIPRRDRRTDVYGVTVDGTEL
jgi:N-carbamoylputrescine amidase